MMVNPSALRSATTSTTSSTSSTSSTPKQQNKAAHSLKHNILHTTNITPKKSRFISDEHVRKQLTGEVQFHPSLEGQTNKTASKDFTSFKHVDVGFVVNDQLGFNCTNTILIGYELRVTRNNKNVPLTVNSKSYSNTASSKRTFRGNTSSALNTKNYDRIVFCGDIKSRVGQMFVVISDQQLTSNKLLQNVHHHPIGNLIGVVEPEFENKYLGNTDTLPIISTKKAFISCHDIPFEMKASLFPVPLNIPDTGCFKYFFLTDTTITVNNITMEKACCSGILCDRQERYDRSKKCGSLEKPNPHSAQANVLECNTFVMVNGEPTVWQKKMRSYTFTCLFVSESMLRLALNDLQSLEELLRNHVTKMIKYVNDHGKWNVLGWYKTASADVEEKGETADATLTGQPPRLHFILLEPVLNCDHSYLRKHLFTLEQKGTDLLKNETLVKLVEVPKNNNSETALDGNEINL